MEKKPIIVDKDLSSYAPKPFKVKNPSIQTAPPQNLSPGPMPSKETFPGAGKKEL
jgi:hypothetical protein